MVLPAYDEQNIFAKILRGEIPSHKIFETQHALAILDAMPMAEGHSLLLPKYPCVSILDMPAEVASAVLSELPRLAKMVRAATGAPSVKIVQNTGAEAGQEVFHCHFHVIPRFHKDDKMVSSKEFITLKQAQPLLAKMQVSESVGQDATPLYRSSLDTLGDLLVAMKEGDITKPPEQPFSAAAGKSAKAAASSKKAAEGGGGGKGGPPEGVVPGVKKEKVKKAAPAKAEGGGGDGGGDRPVDVSWADIRVGKILDASPHPESDKLYVETIDLGEDTPRQILSGLAHHMKLEEVKGAEVVCICNLKTRKLAGMDSHGMVLCASDATKSKLCFVAPPKGSAPGDAVTWDGYPGEAETSKKMDKKKAWEAIQPLLGTDGSGTCVYKGAAAAGTAAFRCKAGICTATVTDGIIS